MIDNENLKKEKELIIAISNLKIEIIKKSDGLSNQSLINIKREARELYECLVCLQYDAKEADHDRD
ncbi:topoisomerase [Streptococcus gordonii]|uniref:topoisomerase n=1 Tax=Streptococcus gordonii TaxID=1302 RepID=UPI002284D8A7|nr:topoisomerase [Streptococcus gordonii]MCY7133654.1 topoisomerase [Streptococcus gordonii]